MSGEYVISACAGIFPGAETPEEFWNAIVAARVAPPQSLEKIWGVPRAKYFSDLPGAVEKTYLDLGHCLPVPFSEPSAEGWRLAGEGRQLQCGELVLKQLLQRVTGDAPTVERMGLVLGTSWSDASYFADDIRAAVLDIAASRPACTPSVQLESLAKTIGLGGPRIAVDTACASSLYALSNAIEVLRGGLADSVVVMGLNAYLPPFLYIGFSKIQALATKGVCLPFSSEACGIIPGEAVAAVFVESEESALRAGRVPLARIAALGLSADGGERSVFAPGPQGQKLAYARAYQDIDSNEIDYVETHGTGTPLGDETEATCLHEFFSERGRTTGSLAIGSVKSLIGHPLAAAGCASLIKALHILQHRTLPPHISVQPMARLTGSCLRLSKTAEPVPALSRPMRVGVSSLGFGGANAHVVLEEWRPQTGTHAPSAKTRVAITGCELYFGDKRTTAAAFAALTDMQKNALPLRGKHALDASLLRMGPVQASRLDPMIVLFAHVTKGAFQSLPPSISLDDTAVVACSDLGSVASLQFGRKYVVEFLDSLSEIEREGLRKRLNTKDLTVEGITSALPTMLSGLVAAGARARAFHQTYSGGSSVFWNAMMLSYRAFLSKKCKCMVLSAGDRKRSSVDVPSTLHSVEGVLSVGLCDEASWGGGEPLAWIEGVFSGEKSAQEVAGLFSVANQDVICIRVPELDSNAFDFSENAGLDGMARLLASGSGTLLVVQMRGGLSIEGSFSMVLRRAGGAFVPSVREPESPVEVDFADETLRFLPEGGTVKNPTPSSEKPVVVPSLGSSLEALKAWNETAAQAVSALFDANCRVADKLLANYSEQVVDNVYAIQRGALHSVIGIVSRDPLKAQLLVNEEHPYFFDHPLDHVPGILLLEGGFQLAESRLLDSGENPAGCYASRLEISFKKFVEKNMVSDLFAEDADDALQIRCAQGGAECCSLRLQYSQVQPDLIREARESSFAASAQPPVPSPCILHKHRAENVLVSSLTTSAEGLHQVFALSIPPGHFFAEGHSHWHLPLYLLETGRQMMMLLAHGVMGVPLGVPMNLIRLRLSLSRPIFRSTSLVLEARRHKLIEAPGSLLAEIEIHFVCDGVDCGQIAITAQVVDHEKFIEQRKKG
jgi:3-oxoacyl-(acyl-carrier-protein) synthase